MEAGYEMPDEPLEIIETRYGGTSRVLIVKDADDNFLALKRTERHRTLSPSKRLMMETLVTSALGQHPNIASTLFIYEFQGAYWIATDFLEGADLAVFLSRNQSIPVVEGLELVVQLVMGMEYVWRRSTVVHLDLKPANIFVDPLRTLKVLDFGAARPTGFRISGESGTPTYMAPEQFEEGSADTRMDIYSFGLIAHRILSGRHPLGLRREQARSTSSRFRTLRRIHLERQPEVLHEANSDVPKEVSEVIMECIRKSPDDRPPSFIAVRELLSEAMSSTLDIQLTPDSALQVWKDFPKEKGLKEQQERELFLNMHLSGADLLYNQKFEGDISRHMRQLLDPSEVENRPTQVTTLQMQGMQAHFVGNREEAMENYLEAEKIDPDHPFTLGQLADELFAMGRYREAAERYERLVGITPRNAKRWLLLAYCRERIKDAPGSLFSAEASLELDYTSAEAWSLRAWALSELGQTVGAVESILMAHRIHPQSRTVTANLRTILQRALEGGFDGAYTFYGPLKEREPSKRKARDWWKAQSRKSAICDSCNSGVRDRQGFLVDVVILMKDPGSGTTFRTISPELVCSRCVGRRRVPMVRVLGPSFVRVLGRNP